MAYSHETESVKIFLVRLSIIILIETFWFSSSFDNQIWDHRCLYTDVFIPPLSSPPFHWTDLQLVILNDYLICSELFSLCSQILLRVMNHCKSLKTLNKILTTVITLLPKNFVCNRMSRCVTLQMSTLLYCRTKFYYNLPSTTFLFTLF